jgi:hypothetical protein
MVESTGATSDSAPGSGLEQVYAGRNVVQNFTLADARALA